MPVIQLPTDIMNGNELDARQYFYGFSIIISNVLYPFDKIKQKGLQSSFHKAIEDKDADISKMLLFCINQAFKDIEKGEKRRIVALHRMTAFLCRMIEHHEQDLKTTASISKARFLTTYKITSDNNHNSTFKKKRIKGFSNSPLKKIWNKNKNIAPLTTATQLSLRRINRKFYKKYNNGFSQNSNKLILALYIAEIPKIISQTRAIEHCLINHISQPGRDFTLNRDDVIRFPDAVFEKITPLPPRWLPLKKHQIECLNRDYRKTIGA